MEITFAQFVQGFTLPVVVCLLVGLVLLVIEMFTPGFGLAGTLGIAALLLAVVLRADSFAAALWMLILVVAIIGVLFLIFLRSATKGAISRSPLVLKENLNRQEGFLTTEDLEYFVGKEGETITVLRPSGIADIGGVKLDVVSEGEFIPIHSKIEVIRVEGRRILVRPKEEEKTA